MRPMCDATRKMFSPIEFAENDVVEIHLQENGKFLLDIYRLEENWRIRSISDADIAHALASGLPDPRDQFPKTRNYCRVMKHFVNRFPEIKYVHAEGCYEAWEVPAVDTAVELISQVVPAANIKFADPMASARFEIIKATSAVYDQLSEVIADYKIANEVPEHDYELCAGAELSNYQQIGLMCQQAAPGFGLYMEQGTGKTPIVIAAICNAAKRAYEAWLARKADAEAAGVEFNETFQPYRAIIVCPNNLRLNWEFEFNHFATQAGRLTVLRGTQIDRVKQLIDVISPDPTGELRFSAVICGYQTLYRSWESIKFIPWDMAALDEAHAIKNPKTKQGKTCLELRDKALQRVALTGTPMANSLLDLYMQLEFLVEGGSGFSSFDAFRKYYGEYDRTASGHEVLTGVKNVPVLQERLARMSFFISKKEALPNLPEKVYDIVEIEMGEQQTECYNKVLTQLALEIEQDLANDSMSRQMQVTCILTKLLRLAQITSGFVCWQAVTDPETGEELQPKMYEFFDTNPKIDAAMELLQQQGPNSKTIIWAHWIPDIEYLAHACRHYGIDCVTFTGLYKGYTDEDRQEAVRRFNEDPNCRVFIGTAASGGAGLNLLGYPPGRGDEYETNCDMEIFYSQNWSQILRSQAEDRANRRGTRVPTRIVDLMVPRSIDQQIREAVKGKKEHSLEVSDLKNILTAIKNGE